MMRNVFRHSKKVIIGLLGVLVVLIGIVLIPYPGPGWLIVFAGFAILATEFAFAEKTLVHLKKKYAAWTVWLKNQHRIVQLLVLAFTGLVVLVTVWLLNTFGIIDSFFHLGQDWLHSPFVHK